MASIYVPAIKVSEFRGLYYKWRRQQGDGFVTYPPEGPTVAEETPFMTEDEALVAHLRSEGFAFRLAG